MDTKLNQQKTATASEKSNKSWDDWNNRPMQYSKAEQVIIRVLEGLFSPIALFATVLPSAVEEVLSEESKVDTPDPYLDAFNGIDESQRFWLGKKENIL